MSKNLSIPPSSETDEPSEKLENIIKMGEGFVDMTKSLSAFLNLLKTYDSELLSVIQQDDLPNLILRYTSIIDSMQHLFYDTQSLQRRIMKNVPINLRTKFQKQIQAILGPVANPNPLSEETNLE